MLAFGGDNNERTFFLFDTVESIWKKIMHECTLSKREQQRICNLASRSSSCCRGLVSENGWMDFGGWRRSSCTRATIWAYCATVLENTFL
jgi:hypothetical protein